jgi:hypothetical protein
VIGTVTRVTSAGVTHRYLDKWQADSGTSTPGTVTTDTKLTAYQAGDRVMVVEDSPNDFIVTGIVG